MAEDKNNEIISKTVEALQDESVLEKIGGMGADEIRKSIESLGYMVDESQSDEKICSMMNDGIKRIKGLKASEIEDVVKKCFEL